MEQVSGYPRCFPGEVPGFIGGYTRMGKELPVLFTVHPSFRGKFKKSDFNSTCLSRVLYGVASHSLAEHPIGTSYPEGITEGGARTAAFLCALENVSFSPGHSRSSVVPRNDYPPRSRWPGQITGMAQKLLQIPGDITIFIRCKQPLARIQQHQLVAPRVTHDGAAANLDIKRRHDNRSPGIHKTLRSHVG